MLSLTAMVDMFTVLVVFLLQNYQTTGEVIDISDEVILPKASYTKELKPSHVVVVSKDSIALDKIPVASFVQVKEQEPWMIDGLFKALNDAFKRDEEKKGMFGGLREAVDSTKPEALRNRGEIDKRVTVQADKSVDVLTIKKVLLTLTEAGAEINFAVLKDENKKAN
jgi:biopolymer transport protein ExbD